MTKYKVYVTIDENNSFWIITENSKIISRNPIKEELDKVSRTVGYNKTNICPRCREENKISDKSILYPGKANHDIDKNGKKTEEWVCKTHGLRHYHRYDPDSNTNIKKSMSDRRTGNLRYDRHILGDNCEEETYRLFGAKRLSTETDNYRLSHDHGPIPEGVSIMIGGKLVDLSNKIPQTRGRRYSPIYRRWDQNLDLEYIKKFDILIFYCISEDGKTIERIYIFPKEEIKVSSIGIYENSPRIFEKYRVTDSDVLKKANELWKEVIIKNK